MKSLVSLIFILHHIVSPLTSAWQWVPEDEHPCTVRLQLGRNSKLLRGSGLPPLFPEPIVIRRDDDSPAKNRDNGGASINREFRRMTEKDNLLAYFGPGFNVTLSSSNARSEHRRTTTLQQYIDESLTAFETTPDRLSNETWYLFGETYSDAWRELLYNNYELPPCVTCQADKVALSFGIGNRGSGVQWHVHGPGFSEALHGRKHWVLYPPTTATHVGNFSKDQSSRQWMEYVYPTLPRSRRPVECTLDPGDLIYFPDEWWHATINLDPYTAFISSFTTEHNVKEEGGDDLFSVMTKDEL